jgi:ectoine hydroxylase-related dioxygenase (phytanoyl-CoA dioxygenase family)
MSVFLKKSSRLTCSNVVASEGDVVFHHSQTLHTSHRNESDGWRRSYATHWVTSDVTCTIGTLDKAYHKQGSWQDNEHKRYAERRSC